MRGGRPYCAVLMLDPAGKILSCTAAAARLIGHEATEIVGRPFSSLSAEEGWLVRKDRSRIQAAVVIEPLQGDGGKIVGLTAVILPGEASEELERRVDERIRDLSAANAALQHLADTDELTGILNLRGFLAAAGRELTRATRYKRPLCLLYLDIDQFKAVNDTFGHAAGDRALKMVAEVMGRQLRDGDIMARIGGDEFVMLLRETTSGEATHVAERICEAVISGATQTVGVTFTTAVSVGVARWSPSETIGQLLARADAALYALKSDKKSHPVG